MGGGLANVYLNLQLKDCVKGNFNTYELNVLDELIQSDDNYFTTCTHFYPPI